MQPAKRLRDKVSRGELTTGVLAIDHVWPGLVELCERAGLDYLMVDMEHGPCSTEMAAEVCAVGRRSGFPILIRPRANDYTNIRHAIDLGPVGFLLACVESACRLGHRTTNHRRSRPASSGARIQCNQLNDSATRFPAAN